MTMEIIVTRAPNRPPIGGPSNRAFSAKISGLARGFWQMVQQVIEKAGINTSVVTIIGSLIVAGILGVVALSWENSIHMAVLEQKLVSMSDRMSDMHDDLSAMK